MNYLRNYLYLGRDRLQTLFNQLDGSSQRLRAQNAEVKADFKVLTAAMGWQAVPSTAPGWSAVLDTVVGGLRDREQLSAIRPESWKEYEEFLVSGRRYVCEDMLAAKIHLPIEDADINPRLPKALTVWVGDPKPPSREPADAFDWLGTFVYLVEELTPDGDEPATVAPSGISALYKIAKMAAPSAVPEWGSGPETFGRGSLDHPIAKLASIGATASLPDNIWALYHLRYFQNEQSYRDSTGDEHRMNDLLAYPLAIWRE